MYTTIHSIYSPDEVFTGIAHFVPARVGHSDIGQQRPCVPFLQHGIIGRLERHLSAQDRIHAHPDRPHVGAGAKAALGDLQ